MSDEPLIAAIEAGGTKMVLGLGTAEGGSIVTASVPTHDPATTMPAIAAFFERETKGRPVSAVGIASFGPLDLDPNSPTHGYILPASKVAWSNFDMLGSVRKMLGGIPGMIDTDVNAAALAEAKMGAGEGTGDLAYVTVGTGIGIGLVVNGAMVHGASHPEGGHVKPRRHPAHGQFAGVCPFHHDCFEGLASGPAIIAAWGGSLATLPHDHVAWEVQADYCAQIAAMLILTVSPVKLVFGGGVMKQEALFGPLRDRTAALLGGYGRDTDRASLESRIVPPGCKEAPGLVGAYLLAENAKN
ncbi:ROK family protein [Sphingomonas sp. MMS24-J13]|uniref:ROK family protein n=1 Tax=Sphingomonas sp. MMS24-J13 TaxID=3238686 RepID=UPI00384B64CF